MTGPNPNPRNMRRCCLPHFSGRNGWKWRKGLGLDGFGASGCVDGIDLHKAQFYRPRSTSCTEEEPSHSISAWTGNTPSFFPQESRPTLSKTIPLGKPHSKRSPDHLKICHKPPKQCLKLKGFSAGGLRADGTIPQVWSSFSLNS